MPLTDEQAKNIKEQILKQVESFPADKREQIKQYIASLDNQQLEDFLIKNKMIQQEGDAEEKQEETKEDQDIKKPLKKQDNQCIYCLISEKKVEAFALYEDKDYLAVLEINPLSQGHTILIPKKHTNESKSLKSKSFTLANKIGRHIIKKLKAENFQVNSSDDLGHALINIIPVYKNQKITGERKPASKPQLQELAIKIGEIKKREKVVKIKTEKSEKKEEKQTQSPKINLLKLPRRIP